jgi:hypothetical protein
MWQDVFGLSLNSKLIKVIFLVSFQVSQKFLYYLFNLREFFEMNEKKTAYRLLARKPEGERQLGRPRRRGVDNISMLESS